MVTALRPSSSSSEPFQAEWAPTATTYPITGASTRTSLLRDVTAIPIPMPMNEVKNGWANGAKMQRAMNRPKALPIPPAWPSSPMYAEAR